MAEKNIFLQRGSCYISLERFFNADSESQYKQGLKIKSKEDIKDFVKSRDQIQGPYDVTK